MDEIEVSVTVDWHEQQKMLKLRFPLNIIQMKATYEIPYGHIERMTNGEEEPGRAGSTCRVSRATAASATV
jgi:alpha-mannosidase